MIDKTTSMREAIATVADGARVAIGGNTLHRGPCAAVHEIVRQGKRGLEIVKTAGAYDVDLLAGTGCATSASVGFVGFETVFGMAPGYRRAVERGELEVKEHACYSVIAGLRAAIQGVPFMPIAGMQGSDVPEARGFKTVVDPYAGQAVVAIPALVPDVAIIHVQEADSEGNARIVGTRFEDVLMAQAARRVIVTAERIVDGASFEETPELVAVPGFMVDAVVEAPRGAWPCSCAGYYDYDAEYLADYVAASKDEAAFQRFVETRILESQLVGAPS
ncbi:MAG: glutaconate CoA-transferase, subunit [Thermomicrobiales bacterium]|jgi:glutaconate CoA-transferase subunit A|nr:glutaconate CoA-transferase, subunit [Thermomicrobiales bacterium]